jgi:hypothetical protein
MELDEEDTELRNPFPSPPSHYTNYTNHNLKLLRLLKERSGDLPPSQIHQREVLSDQHDVPEWPLTQLEKPRADWILEDPEGSYDVFGDRWFVRLIMFTRSQYILSESLADQGAHSFVGRVGRTPAVPGRPKHWYVVYLYTNRER